MTTRIKKTGVSLRFEIQDGGTINERLLLGHSPIKNNNKNNSNN